VPKGVYDRNKAKPRKRAVKVARVESRVTEKLVKVVISLYRLGLKSKTIAKVINGLK
jgi:hypothetical protein